MGVARVSGRTILSGHGKQEVNIVKSECVNTLHVVYEFVTCSLFPHSLLVVRQVSTVSLVDLQHGASGWPTRELH